MTTKWIDKNNQGDIEAVVSLTDHEIIFLKEVVKMYNDKRLGDIDDKNIIKIKQGLKEEFENALKQLRPS